MNDLYSNSVTMMRSTVMQAAQRTIAFLPNVFSAVLILLVGLTVGKLTSFIVAKLFKSFRLDAFAERHGIDKTLHDVGITARVSVITSKCAFWLIVLITLEPVAETLHWGYISALVARLLSYIPTALAAALILLLGWSFARLLGNMVTRNAQAANLEYANALGMTARYFISLIVLIVALAQLGVQTAILTIVFAVILISLGIAGALALGIGSRAVVANILAGALVRDHFPEGREIEVLGVRGKVVAVNSVGTTVAGEGKTITVPNTVLMEHVVE